MYKAFEALNVHGFGGNNRNEAVLILPPGKDTCLQYEDLPVLVK